MKRYLILMLLLICVPVFAQRKLTTNEAVKLAVGPFFDSTDGITPETGITVTALTVEIYREFDADTTPTRFANFVPTTSGGGVNDMVLIGSSVSGMYSLEVTAAQLNFTGPLMLTIVDTDSAGIVGLPYWRPLILSSANVVDAEYGTDKLQVDTTLIEGQDATNAINIEVDTVAMTYNIDHLVKLAVDTDIQTTVHDDSVFGYLMATASFGAGGSYDRTADSLQSIRDRGDSAWDTAVGFSTHSAADVTDDWESQSQSNPSGFHVNLYEVNGNSAPIGNWEDMFDGTGYADDNAPATQVQLATVSGGVSIPVTASSRILTEGEETLTYAVTASHDGSYYEVASDAINDDIDFYLVFNTGDGMNLPVTFHMHGYYEDNNAPANSTLVVQAYNFNIADWETIITLSDSATDLSLDLPLHVHDIDPDGGGEGDVRIRFKLSATEVLQNMLIDHATVNYVSGGLTAEGVWAATTRILTALDEDDTTIDLDATATDLSAITSDKVSYKATGFATTSDITTAHSTTDTLINGIDDDPWNNGTRTLTANTNFNDPTAAAIVNEWESQSNADPTGFKVNLMEVNGTAQTANDMSGDINDILADTNELQTDWTNGGRLDLIIDIIQAYWDSLTITDGLLEVIHGNI